MKLVTASEMRRFDEITIRELGVPGVVLMESAGRAVADRVAELLGPRLAGARVAVVAGGGNNGGDGFVAARHLWNRGADARVILAADRPPAGGDAGVHFEAARAGGVPILDGRAGAGFAEAESLIDRAEVIVDALLGTGVTRAVEGHLAAVIAHMNAAPGVRVAVDLPSGMDADSGVARGACVSAQHTVTFGFAKLGLCGSPGFARAGELRIADIGIPGRLAEQVKRALLDERCLDPLRAAPDPLAHKGTRGHALIVAGSRGHSGAALLCGEACARAGAGLVTIASPDQAQRAIAARAVEVMTAPLGPEPLAIELAWARLQPLLDGKRAVAFGPGVPRDPGTALLLRRVLEQFEGPIVVDADGLNLLAEHPALLGRHSAQLVLTPHPGEMGRLAGLATVAVQEDRVGVAEAFASRHGVVVLLKGARTVIAGPDGRTAICPVGGPALGTGGTGDVLTGVVAALLAAGLDPFAAACAGAWMHGRAGDLAAVERGPCGVIARDVIEALPRARR